TTPARRSAKPTAAEPMSLTRRIWPSLSRDTRSASFSIAVFNSSTMSTRSSAPMRMSRFQASAAMRKASGRAARSATSSWRKAGSLRATSHRPCHVLMPARISRSMHALPPYHAPVGQLWAGSPLLNINDGIWSEFQAQLQEHAEIVDLPVDRLRNSSYSHSVILEVSQTLRRLHVPIASTNPDAPWLRHTIGD